MTKDEGYYTMQTKADNSYHTFQEIINQPQAWQAVLQEASGRSSAVRSYWRPEETQEVIFIGCGSTYYLARTAAAIFQGMTGAVATAHPASDVLLFPDITLSQGGSRMLVAISRSGETTETLRAMEQFRARDSGPVIGITCYEDTTLVRMASISLVAREAHEQSVAQTRSFASMLVAIQALSTILAGRPMSDKFLELPELGTALIEENLDLARQLGGNPAFERFFFLGSGPFYGLACEAMLKMKEMSLSYSEAFQFLEFRHGPMSMVNQQTLIVGLLSETALPHELALLKDMRALGAKVLAVTPLDLSAERMDYQVVLPKGLTDMERGVLYLPVLQLMAFYRSLRNKLNPDRPTNLTAVVSLDIDRVSGRKEPDP
jgi:glucosamine--fructose-6-phosphate aminotransferase (isomerizing)